MPSFVVGQQRLAAFAAAQQGADAGQDLVEQLVSRWWAQGERAGVTDQPRRYADQPVSQGGDHGLTAVLGGQAAHGDRLGEGAGAVVDPRQDVAVQVDHQAAEPAPALPAFRGVPSSAP